MSRATLENTAATSTIEWPHVTISPLKRDAFPADVAESHYYKARATDAATLLVNGQTEKFLFYRGVADFDVPITVEVLGSDALRIRNTGSDPLPAVIAFEKRGAALGYRVLGPLSGEVTIGAPALDGSFAQLRKELEQVLTRAGLYPKEAAAMVETWRDSWFEEGTRVFYIVPSARTDAILPLTITPAPEHVARVFVGRMDVITPAMLQMVEQSLGSDNDNALDSYARLLEPISARLLQQGGTPELANTIARAREASFNRYVSASSKCQ
jgi:hypothetical protein